ncbi:MAG TPA: arabinofuranosidase catalytic domain-containing protein, partial [Polyangiaceae bacterium]|nr:arabinofuranosidase catalytic domain-containing protein [Polyangiaceae bacterium]
SPVAHWLPNGGVEANAANAKITVGGHTAHGIYVTANSNVAYRNNSTKGVAKGDEPEAMYMIVDGKRFNDSCCFDYGNAETSGNDDGNGTMEAVYWGSDITWGGKGEGSGPWVAADLENGVFKGNKGGWQSQSLSTPSAKSVIAQYATAMLKGPSGNHFTLKAGSAQSGQLTTMWDGTRPSSGYSPKKLQGAIILGTGGDGSNTGTGTFFEGAMTSGVPSDAVDEAIQANIVAAGYGR